MKKIVWLLLLVISIIMSILSAKNEWPFAFFAFIMIGCVMFDLLVIDIYVNNVKVRELTEKEIEERYKVLNQINPRKERKHVDTDLWLWCLAIVPTLVSIIIKVPIEDWWGYFIVNTIFAALDMSELGARGYDTKAMGLDVWWIFLVPVYIYKRIDKTTKDFRPFILFFVLFACEIFLSIKKV